MSADAVAFNEHVIGIYDGRLLIGEILIGRTIRATDRDGTELGTFRNREEATRAIIEAAKANRGSASSVAAGGA
jgi:hypothetical protein